MVCLQETKLQEDHVAEVSAALKELHLPRFEGDWHWCVLSVSGWVCVWMMSMHVDICTVRDPHFPRQSTIHTHTNQPKRTPPKKQLHGQEGLLRHRRALLPGLRAGPHRGHLRDRAGGGGWVKERGVFVGRRNGMGRLKDPMTPASKKSTNGRTNE